MRRNPEHSRLAVIVTAHPPLYPYLEEALETIDAQNEIGETRRILVLDRAGRRGNEFLDHPKPGPGWETIQGDWSNPGAARNKALEAIENPWVIFWDGDNRMPENYVSQALARMESTDETTGILYPAMRLGNRIASNDRSGDTRLHFFVDTSSAWRADAIRMAGGWSEDLKRLEDWDLGNRIQRSGWKLEPIHATVTRRDHGSTRSRSYPLQDAVWESRTLGILTLHRGSTELLTKQFAALDRMELPAKKRVGLTIFDDSQDPAYRKKLAKAITKLGNKFGRTTVITAPAANIPPGFASIHDRVGHNYSRAIAATPEDTIAMWEDDVIPHEPETALKKLSDQLMPNSDRAACAAVYESRSIPGHAVASTVVGSWSRAPKISEIPKHPINVTMLAGGLTLWRRAALEQIPILSSTPFPLPNRPEARLGWDGWVSDRLYKAGWRFTLHGAVTCDHITEPKK